MVGSVLHHILGCEACELQFCTIRLYYKPHFIYLKLTVSHIRAFVFFIVMLEHFWSICSCNYQNKVKKALSKVSVNHSNAHLVKLYATELNLFYGKYSFALHNLWLLPNISRNFSILHKITFIWLDVDLMCKERMLSFILLYHDFTSNICRA